MENYSKSIERSHNLRNDSDIDIVLSEIWITKLRPLFEDVLIHGNATMNATWPKHMAFSIKINTSLIPQFKMLWKFTWKA